MAISPDSSENSARPTLRAFLLYFLRLGALGFGGPIALVGYMQRDLVENRKWVSKEDYFEGLAFSQLCPGPLAAQLAKYIGWVHSGSLGATLTGAAFVLPSFLMVLGLASLYVHFGQLAVDPGIVLRHRGGSERHHRTQRLEAYSENAGQRLPVVDPVQRTRGHYGLDAVGGRLAVRVVWIRGHVGEGATQLANASRPNCTLGTGTFHRAPWTRFGGHA